MKVNDSLHQVPAEVDSYVTKKIITGCTHFAVVTENHYVVFLPAHDLLTRLVNRPGNWLTYSNGWKLKKLTYPEAGITIRNNQIAAAFDKKEAHKLPREKMSWEEVEQFVADITEGERTGAESEHNFDVISLKRNMYIEVKSHCGAMDGSAKIK